MMEFIILGTSSTSHDSFPEVVSRINNKSVPGSDIAIDVITNLSVKGSSIITKTRFRYLWYFQGEIDVALNAYFESEFQLEDPGVIYQGVTQKLVETLGKIITVAEAHAFPVFILQHRELNLLHSMLDETPLEKRWMNATNFLNGL